MVGGTAGRDDLTERAVLEAGDHVALGIERKHQILERIGVL